MCLTFVSLDNFTIFLLWNAALMASVILHYFVFLLFFFFWLWPLLSYLLLLFPSPHPTALPVFSSAQHIQHLLCTRHHGCKEQEAGSCPVGAQVLGRLFPLPRAGIITGFEDLILTLPFSVCEPPIQPFPLFLFYKLGSSTTVTSWGYFEK